MRGIASLVTIYELLVMYIRCWTLQQNQISEVVQEVESSACLRVNRLTWVALLQGRNDSLAHHELHLE